MDEIDELLDKENDDDNDLEKQFHNLWTDYEETIEILGLRSGEINYNIDNNNNISTNQVKDALFTTAEVLGVTINVLIDTGSKGCVVAKHFLDKVNRTIDEPSNIKVVDITGNKTTPLG